MWDHGCARIGWTGDILERSPPVPLRPLCDPHEPPQQQQLATLLRFDFVWVLVRLWQVALRLDLWLLLLLVGLVEALLLALQLFALTSSLEVGLHKVHEHVSLEHVGEEEHGDRGRGVDAVEQAQDTQHHDHESGHYKDHIVEPLARGHAVLLVKDLGQHEDVRDEVAEVVQRQQTHADTLESESGGGRRRVRLTTGQISSNKSAAHSLEVISGTDNGQTDQGMYDLLAVLLPLHLLEVQLGKHMQIVGQLDDEVQLHEEAHRVIGVAGPGRRKRGDKAVANHDLDSPQEGHQAEEDQLAGLVEAAQLRLGRDLQFLGEFL